MKRILSIPIIGCFALLLALSTVSCKNGSEENELFLFKHLEKGRFEVGYKSIWKLDTSRQYRLDRDSNIATPNQRRPILMNIWYPTVSSVGNAMEYGEYFDIDSSGEFEAFSKTLLDFNINVVSNELLDRDFNELDSLGLQAIEYLFKKQTLAYKNAPFPVKGKFPLIIYHGGAQSSFDDNSVLCEFLASHGYVVIGSAYQHSDGTTLSVDAGEGSFKDIDFLVKEAGKLDFINTSDLTLIGHSLGAQMLLKYQSEGLSKAKAIVPIDATFEYQSMHNDLYWSHVIGLVKSNKHQFTNRLLAISEYTSFYQLYETLELTDRYYLSVGHLTHNEFISQGILKKWMNNKLGLSKQGDNRSLAEVSKRYVLICETILDFISEKPMEEVRLDSLYINFEFHLKGEEQEYLFNQSIPPTPRELFILYQKKGVDEALKILEYHKHLSHSSPIYRTQYGFSWVFDLLSQNRVAEAKKVETYFNGLEKEGIKDIFAKNINFGKKHNVSIIVDYYESKLKLLEN